jgi:PPK2 family polyphosphate:nucleotide phosphotransferase
MAAHDITNQFRVAPGTEVRLKDFDPGWEGDTDRPKKDRKQQAQKLLSEDVTALAAAQELLYAADSHAILVIFQALDAAGKDGTIKHVMSGVNPQGCQVYSFKHPSSEELDHDFMWRCARVLPERGRIGIFNRSYYEEVLIVKVHKEMIASQRIPGADPDSPKFWQARYEDINAFERHLTRNGTVILKFYLNLSRGEQRKRLLKRLDDPAKHWKFSATDLAERAHWDDYVQAYEEMLTATSTKWAPWYVIPADHKWVTRSLVANILTGAIQDLNLTYPKLTDKEEAALADARKQLEHEGKSKASK